MPRTTQHPKDTTFNFRLDPDLKTAFTAATGAEDKPAAQVLRDFMRGYVSQRERAAAQDDLRRQVRESVATTMDPSSDDHISLKEIETLFEESAFDDEWTP